MPITTIVALITSWGESISFSRVASHIISDLPETWDYRIFALDIDNVVDNHRIIPCNVSQDERDCAHWTMMQVAKHEPAIVVFYYDLFVAPHYMQYLTQLQARGVKTVAYLPIDGQIADRDFVELFKPLDALVFFTESHRRQFIDVISASASDPRLSCCIAHALDTEIFYPLALSESEQSAIRKEVFNSRDPAIEQSFLVLNGNREIERKRLDLTVRAYAGFVQMDTAMTHLVLPRVDPHGPIASLVHELGIRDRVLMGNADPSFRTIEELNILYNVCDVGINSAMGEGWGLMNCEHGLVGQPQVVPCSPHLNDIWSDAAIYIPIQKQKSAWAMPGITLDLICPSGLAKALKHLHSNYEDRITYSNKARERMLSSEFSLSNIARQWRTLFTELCA